MDASHGGTNHVVAVAVFVATLPSSSTRLVRSCPSLSCCNLVFVFVQSFHFKTLDGERFTPEIVLFQCINLVGEINTRKHLFR